jgi:hypothetical protein
VLQTLGSKQPSRLADQEIACLRRQAAGTFQVLLLAEDAVEVADPDDEDDEATAGEEAWLIQIAPASGGDGGWC